MPKIPCTSPGPKLTLSRELSPPGPERLTVPERLTRPTHLPYTISCLMISLVAGGPGSFLVFYLGSLNIGQAWSETVLVRFCSILTITYQVSAVQGLADVVVS